MMIQVVTPAPPGSRSGNRITAERWGAILSSLGHEVKIVERRQGEPCDLLVALHARKSAEAVRTCRENSPATPIVLALTGTDLYRDIHENAEARASLDHATFLVTLHEHAAAELPPHLRARVRTIHQSVTVPEKLPDVPHSSRFRICVVGHLRDEKDPFRTALATRLLPGSSRIEVVHLGKALSDETRERAKGEQAENPRYRWMGEVSPLEVLAWIRSSRVLCLTSKMEGGANVVGEAIRLGTPVLSSRISGSTGLLGTDYPGLFPVGDTRALADLLLRVETDEAFLDTLVVRCQEREIQFTPSRERDAWKSLLEEVEVLHT
jgi:putative glycosyltransferase (TIGR04348 family)